MKMIIENSYDFIINKDGEVLLIVNSYDGEPDNPKLLFDGSKVALFYRRRDMPIRLADLPEKIIPNIKSNKEILVCEMGDDGDFARAYSAPILATATPHN